MKNLFLNAMKFALMMTVAMMFFATEGAHAQNNVNIDGLTNPELQNAIQNAINAAKKGETITVTGNATNNGLTDITIPAGKKVQWTASLTASA